MTHSQRYERADELGIDMHTDQIRPNFTPPDALLYQSAGARLDVTLSAPWSDDAWIKTDSRDMLEIRR
jgi:hypothetical protein